MSNGEIQNKGFLEYVLKHYPDVSDKQLKTIDINFYQLQRYLNKNLSNKEGNDSTKFLKKILNKNDNQTTTNKFKYDFPKNWVTSTGQLLESWQDEDSWFNADDYSERELKNLENKVYKSYNDKNGNLRYNINKKELSYNEYTVEPEEFNEIYIDYPASETIIKVFNTYLFYYYDNAITGFLSLVETDRHNRYIVGEICDMLQEEGNFYLGKADNIDKKDFDKNIDYLITEYLSTEMGEY